MSIPSEALKSGAVIPVEYDQDMGLFPPAAERAFRFMCSRAIQTAIETTDGPINIVTVGSSFPWVAAMQTNEHLKRSDSAAKQTAAQLNAVVNNDNFEDYGLLTDQGRTNQIWRRALQADPVTAHVRTALTELFFAPPTELTTAGQKRNKRDVSLQEFFVDYFTDADAVSRPKNEPANELYRGNGGWSTIAKQPTEPLIVELTGRLGTAEQAEQAIQYLAKTCTTLCPPRIRPFEVTVLDTRTPEELAAQAEIIYADHPEVTETSMFQEAMYLAEQRTPQQDEGDLSMLEDESATVVIIGHWPLRHSQDGGARDMQWAPLLSQLHRVLKTNGVATFFPWELPTAFDPSQPNLTLSGVQSLMVNDYGFDVQIAGEPTTELLKAIAVFGEEAAWLAPQMQRQQHVGRLIARKRRGLNAVLK